jgi:hypothetical protein
MKRLLIKLLILALLALVYFSACKKPEDCWRCQHVNTATGAMYYRTYCDMTQDDIEILEMSLAKEHIMSACSPLK